MKWRPARIFCAKQSWRNLLAVIGAAYLLVTLTVFLNDGKAQQQLPDGEYDGQKPKAQATARQDAGNTMIGTFTGESNWAQPEAAMSSVSPTHGPQNLLFLTALNSGYWHKLSTVVSGIGTHFPGHRLLIYDLGLTEEQRAAIPERCGDRIVCELRRFNFSAYPPHVSQLKKYAWKPLIIRKVLSTARQPFVLWMDMSISFQGDAVDRLLGKAERTGGVIGWEIGEPVTIYTHPAMLTYFGHTPEQFRHVTIVMATMLLFKRTPFALEQVVGPWVDCALHEECIAPRGATLGSLAGCHSNEPFYSGCHRYDQAAITIVLARAYNFTNAYEGEGIGEFAKIER